MAARKKSTGAKPAPKRRKSAAKAKDAGGNKGLLVGAGIGSAAIAAALLWVTRAKKKPAEPK
ncbi:hypothetical protein [Sphingomonas bacterium]|uniref:hypothetical protein n=1 Tax=Sphingomonas bacterium TaxID=1895847 RepID=UPI001575CB51|nr:hypothetical protein [Sphingomonas bacterium]